MLSCVPWSRGATTGIFLMPRHCLVPQSHYTSFIVLVSREMVAADGSPEESAPKGRTLEAACARFSVRAMRGHLWGTKGRHQAKEIAGKEEEVRSGVGWIRAGTLQQG